MNLSDLPARIMAWLHRQARLARMSGPRVYVVHLRSLMGRTKRDELLDIRRVDYLRNQAGEATHIQLTDSWGHVHLYDLSKVERIRSSSEEQLSSKLEAWPDPEAVAIQ